MTEHATTDICSVLQVLQYNSSSTSVFMQSIIGAPLPSRLHGYLASPSCCVLLELLGLVKLFVQEKEDNSLTKVADTAAELVTAAVHRASGMIKACGSKGADQLSGRRALLEYVVNTVEVRFCSYVDRYYRYCLNFYLFVFSFNPLMPELNPFAQRCLTRFFTGDFAS
jgi:hypothetical protein